MCSYETIFNSVGKLIDSYGVRNPMDLVAGLFEQLVDSGGAWIFLVDVIWHTVKLVRTISTNAKPPLLIRIYVGTQ